MNSARLRSQSLKSGQKEMFSDRNLELPRVISFFLFFFHEFYFFYVRSFLKFWY